MIKAIIRDARNSFKNEQIDISNRHVGIAYTAFAWFLIALSSVFFTRTRASHSLVNNCFHHYLAAFMAISLWGSFKSRKNFFCKNPILVGFNSVVCSACYYLFFIFRAEPASIYNSYLLNADALILALVLSLLLKKRVPFLSWLGLVMGFVGLMSFWYFKVDFSSFKAIIDALRCLGSASLLVVLVLLTKHLLKNNPPIVIALSHCLVGLFFSGVLLFFQGWQKPSHFELFCMGADGFLYGIALYFFITSLNYTEAYITMSLSYLTPVFLLFLSLFLHQGGYDIYNIVGTILVVAGVALVPIPVYLRDFTKNDALTMN